jgi:integrase
MRKPILYKHRGSWYARFWNESEKKYKSKALGVKVEGKTERKKEAYETALKLDADKTKFTIIIPDIKIEEKLLIDYVLNFWKKDSEYVREKALLERKPLSNHYLLTNRRMVETKIKSFEGFKNLALKDLSKPIIRQWKLWLAEKGYSGRTINGAMLALRVPVKRAFQDDIISTDPFYGVPRAAHKEKIRGILTPTDIRALIETPVKCPRSRLSIYLSLYCSMRMGEVRGLKWGDISDGIIHIRHNWQETEGLKTCKCGSEGYVPMPRIVAELINDLYKIAPCKSKDDFVMSIRPYKPISREYLWAVLKNELDSIGINEELRKQRNIVYHSLRHSFVTACRLAGLSDFETMTLSRHKDVKMLQRYSHGQEAIDIKGIGKKLEISLLT